MSIIFLISHEHFTEATSVCSSLQATPQGYTASCISIQEVCQAAVYQYHIIQADR